MIPEAQSLDGLSWPSISFAILIATLLASAYVLWRSRRLLVIRVAELEALSAAGHAIVASELDVEALCELIADEVGKVIDNQTFQVGLFEDGFYHIVYWRINGAVQETPRTFDLNQDAGIVGWMRDSKQPLLVRDFQREMASLPARPRYISDAPPRSAVFIPLISGEQTIGIIAAQSQRPSRFNDEDLRRLMILANQAAAGIANAQLYERERMRAAHLELVGQIARQVNAVSDPDEIFTQVVALTQETFGFHPVSIFGVDPQTGVAVIQASSLPELSPYEVRLEPNEGLVGTAVFLRQTVLSRNTREDSRFLAELASISADLTPDTQSEIAIPLLVNGNVLGVLDVQSNQANAFGPTERTVLEALAAEVAAAIHKAQQLGRQRERAWITTAQLQVAEAISRSDGLEEIATAVTRLTPMLTGVAFCGLLLWQDEWRQYQGSALYDSDHGPDEAFSQVQLTVGDWPPLDAVHVGRERLATSKIPDWLKRATGRNRIEEITLLPVDAKAQPLGVLVVSEYGAPAQEQISHHYAGARHEELLRTITQQTAQAIESAQLRMAQQEEAWVNTALLQVAEAVNSLIDLNEILDTIVRLVPMLVGAQSAIILIWDEERGVFIPGPGHGITEMSRGLLGTLEVDEEEFASLIQQPTEAPTTSNVYYTIDLPPWLEKVMGKSRAYAFPLNARGRLVGAMAVALADTSPDDNRHQPSPRRLNILNGIAHQAATAVVNHQLYYEAAERQRLEQELNVAREIQSSLIPHSQPAIPGCSVAAYWQAARQVSGDFYDFLPLANDCWGIVIADVADKGVPAALFMALSRTILRTVAFNRTNPAEVLMRVNELIVNDTQSDLFVTVFYAIWRPQTNELVYANGGHNPPLLLGENGRFQLLRGDGIALGVLPQVTIEKKTIHLQASDTVILYTDGVTEAMNEDDDEFGLERLRIAATSAKNEEAIRVVEAITGDVRDHAGDTPQFDDITLVVMKRK